MRELEEGESGDRVGPAALCVLERGVGGRLDFVLDARTPDQQSFHLSEISETRVDACMIDARVHDHAVAETAELARVEGGRYGRIRKEHKAFEKMPRTLPSIAKTIGARPPSTAQKPRGTLGGRGILRTFRAANFPAAVKWKLGGASAARDSIDIVVAGTGIVELGPHLRAAHGQCPCGFAGAGPTREDAAVGDLYQACSRCGRAPGPAREKKS